ncbi:MAG: phage tail protein [Magnetococcales bacterium]|nr:phage tail protein [Magnetococcales bacterium]
MDSYLGEIRLFPGRNTPPSDWALCNGQSLNINGNEALFALIGVTYGGDGVTNFNLPDLRGRLPISAGVDSQLGTYVLGKVIGATDVTLTANQIPPHSHALMASPSPATSDDPGPTVVPGTTKTAMYGALPAGTNPVAMADGALTDTQLNQSHPNIMPCLGMNFIISLRGIFPSKP